MKSDKNELSYFFCDNIMFNNEVFLTNRDSGKINLV